MATVLKTRNSAFTFAEISGNADHKEDHTPFTYVMDGGKFAISMNGFYDLNELEHAKRALAEANQWYVTHYNNMLEREF